MVCCKDKSFCQGAASFSPEQTEAVKLSAVNFGLDQAVVADVLSNWGPVVLGTVVEALRNGFSAAFVMEMLTKFGPRILTWFVGIFNQKKMLEANGVSDVFPPNSTDGNVVSASVLVTVLEQIVPLLFAQFGQQILKAVEEAIMNALKNNFQEQAAAAAAAKAAAAAPAKVEAKAEEPKAAK